MQSKRLPMGGARQTVNNKKAAVKLKTEIVAREKLPPTRICPAKIAAITLTTLQNILTEATALVHERINLAEMQIDDLQTRKVTGVLILEIKSPDGQVKADSRKNG